ncbi:MAG: hypothetical protein ABSA83_01870 [Verrucomicrobiota bacterium]|jgi:hypothetical protein
MQHRPVSVTIFGILNIGFGVLGVITTIVSMALHSPGGAALSPIIKKVYDNPGFSAWMKIATPLGGVGALALIVAGIGLLLLQNWGRLTSIGYAIYGIVIALVNTTLMLHAAFGEQGLTMIILLFAALVGLVIGLVYPALLLIFMTRAKLKAAFGPAQSPHEGNIL